MRSIVELWRLRHNLLALVSSDFRQNYLASYMGFSWAIISPLVNLTVLSLVFQLGFRVPAVTNGIPFVAWLACGLICWQYFSEGLLTGASAVTSYSFLVRKAIFRTGFLPPIKVASAGVIHFCMIFFVIIILLFFRIFPSIYWVQWFYYGFLFFIFLSGLGWLTSSIVVFVPDVSSLLGVIVSIGFWATPIFWNITMIPEHWRWLFHLNPVFYLVQGYRDTFLEQRWLWDRPWQEHFCFFIWFSVVLGLGAFTFKKLRPHFADVL